MGIQTARESSEPGNEAPVEVNVRRQWNDWRVGTDRLRHSVACTGVEFPEVFRPLLRSHSCTATPSVRRSVVRSHTPAGMGLARTGSKSAS